MDPGFRYKLYYVKDAGLSDASEVGLPPETYIFPGVIPHEQHQFLPHVFYSRPGNEWGLGAAEGELGEVQYHPGYLRFYPAYAVCTPVPRGTGGTGVFHPLRSFSFIDGTTMWQTDFVHSESVEPTRQMYLTEEVIYTVERYASSCANLLGDLLPSVEIQSPLSVVRREYTGATARLTPPDHYSSPPRSSESHIGETSKHSLSIDQGGSSSSNTYQHDQPSGSNVPSNSKGKDQASSSNHQSNNEGEDQASAGSNILRNSDGEDQASENTLPTISVKSIVSSKTALPASRASEGKTVGTVSAALSSSRNQKSMNSFESGVKQVAIERVEDIGTESLATKSSLQEDIQTWALLTDKECSYLDSSSKIAHSLPGGEPGEPEGHSGDVCQHLNNEEQEATSDPKGNSQEHDEKAEKLETIPPERRLEDSLAYGDPYRIQQPKDEKHAVTVEEFKGNFLDEELWPALPAPPALVIPKPSKKKQREKKDSNSQPSSSSS